MTYEELVQKLRDAYKDCDASKINEHLAIQFNIQGEAEGALYLEIKDGSIHIEPYEYFDRDILVTVSAADLIALAEGNLAISDAYNDGKLSAEGNLQKGLLLNDVVRPQAAEEAAKKEAEAKAAEEAAKKEAEAKAAEEAAKKEADVKTAEETAAATKPAVKPTGMSRKKNRKRRK